MVAQDRRHFFQALGRGGLQTPGGPGMQLAALVTEHAPVNGFLDEGVAEPVGGLGQLAHLGEQASGAQLGQRRR